MAERSVCDFLKRLKQAPVSSLPKGPEAFRDLEERIDRPGRTSEIRSVSYFDFLRRERPVVRLVCHFATADDAGRVRLFWLDWESKRAFARRLTDAEAEEFAEFFNVAELCRAALKRLGSFRLEDLLPGEDFRDAGGRPCRVCDEQPMLPQVTVWVEPEGVRTMKVTQPRSVVVLPVSVEQARRIARRVAMRKRRAARKRA